MVSDLNKNFGGWTDLGQKKARIGGFAYPYSPPSLNVTSDVSKISGTAKFHNTFDVCSQFLLQSRSQGLHEGGKIKDPWERGCQEKIA